MSGAVIVMRQNRYLRRFAEAGATGPEKAVALDSLGERSTFIFRRMVRAGVFVPAGTDRFYLDLEAAAAFVRRRRRIALGVLALGAVVAGWLIFFR